LKLKGVILLAGHTTRSSAYVQALVESGLEPERVILFGPEKPSLPGQSTWVASSRPVACGLFLPNPGVAAVETCRMQGWRTECLDCLHVNDAPVAEMLRGRNAALVVYSGYGSQVVGPGVLGLGVPFLHVHSGWLPEYRGSTTLYYSLLQEGRCGASAILLESGIDTGPVLARKHYPAPPRGVDPDYVYDCAVRADLLVTVLRHYASQGHLPQAERQESGGTPFYVIHPVLKHLARLKMEQIG
jgi:methionyl-tRNA formyltransferase